LPEPGFAVSVGPSKMTLLAYADYTRRDGEETRLGVWEVECKTCGEPFTTRMTSHILPETKRCEKHRRPVRGASK